MTALEKRAQYDCDTMHDHDTPSIMIYQLRALLAAHKQAKRENAALRSCLRKIDALSPLPRYVAMALVDLEKNKGVKI